MVSMRNYLLLFYIKTIKWNEIEFTDGNSFWAFRFRCRKKMNEVLVFLNFCAVSCRHILLALRFPFMYSLWNQRVSQLNGFWKNLKNFQNILGNVKNCLENFLGIRKSYYSSSEKISTIFSEDQEIFLGKFENFGKNQIFLKIFESFWKFLKNFGNFEKCCKTSRSTHF